MARRGVDYDAGASQAIASQYADLRAALASEGEARNRKKAREIEDRGLFGSGIRQSDISDFASIAMKGAEFGESRMGRKMDRATKSFDRRMKADERRLATLQGRHDKGQLTDAGMAELDGLQFGMKERRDSFEDFMGKYQEKGLWGTSFGGDDVGYRTEGESKWSRDERSKVGGGPAPEGGDEEFTTSNFGGGREMGIGSNKFDAPEGDRIDRYSSYPQGREFEKMDYETGGDGGMPEQPPGESQQVGRHPLADNQEPEGIMNIRGPQQPFGDRIDRYSLYGRKKKADLVGTSGGMADGPPQTSATGGGLTRGLTVGGATESNKFDPNPELGLGESRISRSGKNPARLPMSGALRDLTPLQRRRGDVVERRKLIADKKRALEKNELEQKLMTDKILAKRQRKQIEDLVAGTDWN